MSEKTRLTVTLDLAVYEEIGRIAGKVGLSKSSVVGLTTRRGFALEKILYQAEVFVVQPANGAPITFQKDSETGMVNATFPADTDSMLVHTIIDLFTQQPPQTNLT
jgi:hypothetical protein